MSAKTVAYEDVKAELLQDPETREAYEALEPVYQVARLRVMRGWTQEQLADLVGTKQPSIARFEGGKRDPRLSFLRRVANALGYRVEVRLVPQEEEGTAKGRGMARCEN